ncbi:M23 family metallopeptidase [Streptoverticillium reticulum]|uniref:M23 family metallopeptidase n=1 Tax=Streptoverticillium reticulum TaxID=1433415 RepID=UPI0039BF1E3D
MNDRHPSAGPAPTVPAPDASAYGHYAPSPYEQQNNAQNNAPQGYAGYAYDTYASGGSGHWETTSTWGATSGQTQTWDFSGYDLGDGGQSWDGSGWAAAGSYDTYGSGISGPGGWGTDAHAAAQAGQQQPPVDQAMTQTWDTSGYYPSWNTSAQWDFTGYSQTQAWDTSGYAETAPEAAPEPEPTPVVVPTPTLMTDVSAVSGFSGVADAETCTMSVLDMEETEAPAAEPSPAAPARSRRKGAASRAGYRPRRRALLTVAVPSVAVMGVAGIAAASVVAGGHKDTPHTQAAPEQPVKLSAANSKLDTQLAGLSKGADDFASRASRNQERLDLQARQEEERKRKAEEAARKEAERPKFALPVSQHGLSAFFGQAGVNWMSVHTGIDFPVSYGTPVMAATDGTVSTQYNVAYGNMAKVTSADGTETWYCHLSSYKLRSGKVKAGDVIAYSGNSGNSTGPHLHFEVRPGGSAVDPLPWLRSHDLDPT